MPKYIIHAGPQKTGSTYIQSHLFDTRKSLYQKGVLYPDNWLRPGEITHYSVCEGLREGKDLKPVFDKINREHVDTIILSCEAFGLNALTTTALESLRDYVGDNPIEIVYYVRRWSERLSSLWRQDVMAGRRRTFPEFFSRVIDNAIVRPEVNYSVMWRRYEKIFGRENLKIVSFNNLVEHSIDLFTHFCKVIVGISDAPQVTKGRVRQNTGSDMIHTEIVRALNCVYHMETSRVDPTMRMKYDILQKSNALYDLQPLSELMKTDIKEVQIKDDALFLHPTFEAMSAYRDRLVSPEYGNELFEPRIAPTRFIGQDYLFRRGAADEVERLFRFINSANAVSPRLEALQSLPPKTASAGVA